MMYNAIFNLRASGSTLRLAVEMHPDHEGETNYDLDELAEKLGIQFAYLEEQETEA